jgi:hypothetical protein
VAGRRRGGRAEREAAGGLCGPGARGQGPDQAAARRCRGEREESWRSRPSTPRPGRP